MRRKFAILQEGDQLPDEPTIFADGTIPALYRKGFDLELSHWLPNHTPFELKADTSTEICINFYLSDLDEDQQLVTNNHVDTDGLLSIFALLFPELSQENREVLINAASMGDFGAFGDEDSLKLWTSLVSTLHKTRHASPQAAYQEGIKTVLEVLNGENSYQAQFNESSAALDRARRWLDEEKIKRFEILPRFTHFHIPRTLIDANPGLTPYFEPNFDSGVEIHHILPRQIRNQQDGQKNQLLSIEEDGGHSYDLLLPQYMWAETPDSWRFPGLYSRGSANGYYLQRPDLLEAVETLNRREKNRGSWILATEINPFNSVGGRGFPVILSFIQEGGATPSSLEPEEVVGILKEPLSLEE